MSQTPSPVWGDAEPPSTPQEPTVRTLHGDAFEDPYEWLRAKEEPRVRAQLEAENAYAEAVTAPLAGLRTRLFREIRERVQETDLTVPVRDGAWWWFARRPRATITPCTAGSRRRRRAGSRGVGAAGHPARRELDGEQTVLDAQGSPNPCRSSRWAPSPGTGPGTC
ncbi:Protease 2 [Rothia kristinae]|nr:Protease 2 [Rothia kristinae]